MKANISIKGLVVVGKCQDNEYGKQVTLREWNEEFPVAYTLVMPEGYPTAQWDKLRKAEHEVIEVTADVTCSVFGSGDKRFTKYMVSSLAFEVVEVVVKRGKS